MKSFLVPLVHRDPRVETDPLAPPEEMDRRDFVAQRAPRESDFLAPVDSQGNEVFPEALEHLDPLAPPDPWADLVPLAEQDKLALLADRDHKDPLELD